MRQQRLRSAELFPTDKELLPDEMIGRDGDVQDLARQLANGINLVVAGPRRTGKTSACDAVVGRLRKQGHYVVHADLFKLPGLGALAETLVVSAASNRKPLHKLVASVRRVGRNALRAAQVTATTRAMHELGQEFEIAFAPGLAGRDPHRYFVYALELCQRVAARDDRQLILYVDELQELAAKGHRFGEPDTVTGEMVAILKESDRVTCLFAGSVEHLLSDLFTNEQRAFYKFGEMTSLGPIDEDEWRAGIDALLAKDRCRISSEAFSLLMERTAGHPRAVMLTMQRSHDAAVADGSFIIDVPLIDAGWALAVRADTKASAETLDRVKDLGPSALIALYGLAHGSSPYKQLRPQTARRALDALVAAGIVEEHRRGDWRIGDPLFLAYLQND